MSEKSQVVERRIGNPWPWLHHVVGRYYLSPIICGSQAASLAGIPANELIAIPFLVPYTTTYDRICMNVSLANAGGNVRVGIYNNTTSGATPSSLVLDAGTYTTDVAEAKEIVISQQLARGWYWLAYVHDGNGAGGGWSGADETGNLPWLGVTTTTGTNDTYSVWMAAFTYAALPATFTAGGALTLGSTYTAKIHLRVGSVP